MTSTLERPPLVRPGRPAAQRRSPLTGGLLAALWAALGGLVAVAVPVLLVWAADARSGATAAEAVRAAGQLWLLAHSATLLVPGGEVGIAPLGLAGVPLLLLARAGAHAARECAVAGWEDVGRLVTGVAAPYAVVGAAVASASGTGAVEPAPVESLVGALLLAVLGATAGAARAAGLAVPLPPRAARVTRAGLLPVVGLVAAGAVLAGLSLLLHVGRAVELAGTGDPGLAGGVALLLLGLALVPNAAVWGASWLAGPGFAVGTGTVVGPFAHDLGAVPALPLLAALPTGPLPGWAGPLVLAVPVALGALAGRRLVAWWEGAAAGALAGTALGLLCAVAGGPVGDGRLSAVGPSPWLVGLVVAAEVGVAAAATCWWLRRSAQS